MNEMIVSDLSSRSQTSEIRRELNALSPESAGIQEGIKCTVTGIPLSPEYRSELNALSPESGIDVVVTTPNGDFVTILKDGIANQRVIDAVTLDRL